MSADCIWAKSYNFKRDLFTHSFLPACRKFWVAKLSAQCCEKNSNATEFDTTSCTEIRRNNGKIESFQKNDSISLHLTECTETAFKKIARVLLMYKKNWVGKKSSGMTFGRPCNKRDRRRSGLGTSSVLQVRSPCSHRRPSPARHRTVIFALNSNPGSAQTQM